MGRLRAEPSLSVDQPAQIAVGEDAGEFAAGIDENDSAATAFDATYIVQDLRYAQLIGRNRKIIATAESHGFANPNKFFDQVGPLDGTARILPH